MVSEFTVDDSLTKYNRYILNKIITEFSSEKDINIYQLVNDSVSYKCILPSQNALVMETYFEIKEYLMSYGFVDEKKEMTVYSLTEKGKMLKESGTIEKYEELMLKKNKPSIFHKLFS